MGLASGAFKKVDSLVVMRVDTPGSTAVEALPCFSADQLTFLVTRSTSQLPPIHGGCNRPVLIPAEFYLRSCGVAIVS